MKQRNGFSLIELLLSLSVFSVLIIAVGKLHFSFKSKQNNVKEYRLLLPYLDAFEAFLSKKDKNERCGYWYCYQNNKTKERIFTQKNSNNSWRYKLCVTQIKKRLYEIKIFTEKKYLHKFYYYL